MALRISASTAACLMVGLALVGNVLKSTGNDDRGAAPAPVAVAAKPTAPAPAGTTVPAAPVTPMAANGADRSGTAITTTTTVSLAAPPATATIPPGSEVDDSLPTGSIDPVSGLHRINPAAYGDAAKAGSSLMIGGAEAINYLAGNTLKWQAGNAPPHYTYFGSRGVMAEGTDREFVARPWERNRADLCVAQPGGATACQPVEILLDAKEELQGGRLGTVTIGGATAELVKGNVMHVPAHIPFLDSAVSLAAAPGPKAAPGDGLSTLVDHAAAVTSETGAGRRFSYYGADNRLLDVQPIEAGPEGGHAVRVTVGHWRLSKATICEARGAEGSGQTCYKPQPSADGAVHLMPVAKGGQALRVEPLPETPVHDLAED